MTKKLLFLLKNKQFFNISVYGFGQLFNLVTPLLVVPYIVSICGEEKFGKSAVGMAVCFFLMVFIDYGSDLVGVREVSINRENKTQLERIFTTTYFAKFLLLLAVLSIVTLIILFIPFFKSDKNLYFLGFSVLIGQYLNPTWFLQGIENVKWITISNIISKMSYIILIFFFIKVEQDYIFINLFWGLGMILSNGLFFLLIIKKHTFSFKQCSKQSVSILLKSDFKLFTSQIFVSIQMYSPVILISYFGSNLMAGQYKIVEQVILIFKTYILLFFNYVFPKVCYLLNSNKERGLWHWKMYNGVNFVFVSTAMIVFYFNAYDIVSYFNPTNRFVLSNLLQIAVLYPVLFAISIPLKQLVLGWNFKDYYISLTSIIVVVTLLGIIVLIPYYQVYGVFYSLIISEVLIILFYFLCIKNKLFSQNKL